MEDLKIPYQIFGESLASLCVLAVRGYKVSTQQVSSLYYLNVKTVDKVVPIVKLREREGQRVDPGRSLKGNL